MADLVVDARNLQCPLTVRPSLRVYEATQVHAASLAQAFSGMPLQWLAAPASGAPSSRQANRPVRKAIRGDVQIDIVFSP